MGRYDIPLSTEEKEGGGDGLKGALKRRAREGPLVTTTGTVPKLLSSGVSTLI